MNDLAPLVDDAKADFEMATTPAELENAKALYLGKSGRVTEQLKALAAFPVGEKKALGALIKAAKHETGLPVCAIGGITTLNAGSLIEAGADMLAVISALYDAPDPYQASLRFIQLFSESETDKESA